MNIDKYIKSLKKRLDKPLVVFDLETTGLDFDSDEIIQFGAIRIEPNGTTRELNLKFRPTISIPKEVSDIHGITNADLENCEPFGNYISEIVSFFKGAVVSGFNSDRFDIPMLKAKLAEHGENIDVEVKTYDACKIFHAHYTRKLADAVKFYTGSDIDKAHDALGDVKSTIAVMAKQLEREDDSLTNVVDKFIKEAEDKKAKRNGGAPGGVKCMGDGKYCLTFGKHTGVELSKVPKDYISWFINKSNFDQNFKTWLKTETSKNAVTV